MGTGLFDEWRERRVTLWFETMRENLDEIHEQFEKGGFVDLLNDNDTYKEFVAARKARLELWRMDHYQKLELDREE